MVGKSVSKALEIDQLEDLVDAINKIVEEFSILIEKAYNLVEHDPNVSFDEWLGDLLEEDED